MPVFQVSELIFSYCYLQTFQSDNISIFLAFLVLGVKHYNEIKDVSIDEFLPPHVAIYVDVPAADVYKKIQEKGDVIF